MLEENGGEATFRRFEIGSMCWLFWDGVVGVCVLKEALCPGWFPWIFIFWTLLSSASVSCPWVGGGGCLRVTKKTRVITKIRPTGKLTQRPMIRARFFFFGQCTWGFPLTLHKQLYEEVNYAITSILLENDSETMKSQNLLLTCRWSFCSELWSLGFFQRSYCFGDHCTEAM